MKVLDQLNALDERVLPLRLSSHQSPWWQIGYFVPPAMMLVLAHNAETPRTRLAFLLVAVTSLVRSGRDVERLRIAYEAQGRDLPFPRLRRFAPALVLLAAIGLLATDSIDRFERTIDPIEARALVQTVLDLAGSGDRSDVCEVARDESACREKVASAPPPFGSPEIFKVLPLGEGKTTAVAVYFASTSPPSGCVLVVVNERDRIVIDDPVYWARDCG